MKYPRATLVPASRIREGLTVVSKSGAKMVVLEVKHTEDSVRLFTDDGHYERYEPDELVPHTGTIEGVW